MQEMSFWDHIDVLRWVFLKIAITLFLFGIVLFAAMPYLFDAVILAPCSSDFILYRWLGELGLLSPFLSGMSVPHFQLSLINIELTSQFLAHLSTTFWLSVTLAFPILIYFVWSFVSPALYEHERRNARWIFLLGNLLFYLGVAIGYVVIFPLTLQFFADYQLSTTITNQFTLDSYLSNFLLLLFAMGIVFEMPLLCWSLSSMGLLRRSFFARYRRVAIIVLLALAAIITPTGDLFTLTVVFIPIYVLYELSALIVKKEEPREERV